MSTPSVAQSNSKIQPLCRSEMETCLQLCADDRQRWHVYSDDPVMQRHMEAIGAELCQSHFGGGKTYTLRADQITFRRGKRAFSTEQAKALRAARQNSAHARLFGAK